MNELVMTSVKLDEEEIELGIKFTKVNKEMRLVHGFATLDNIDLINDQIPFEASMDAFVKFAGNIREMHDEKKAVGRMVSFRPETYMDPETGKLYKGVFISVYVSKGAEDTWQKVLDGTLTGFSIGGVIKKARTKITDDGKLRIIEKYSLGEISLVDNPCNQFATVFSFEKGGFVASTKPENVFYCITDNCVQITVADDTKCFECDRTMTNIGFVESDDSEKMAFAKSLLSQVRNAPKEDDFVEFAEGFGKVEKIHTSGKFRLISDSEVIVASETNPVAIIDVHRKKDDNIESVNRRIVKNISALTKIKEETMSEEDVTVVEEQVQAVAVPAGETEEPQAETEEAAKIEEVEQLNESPIAKEERDEALTETPETQTPEGEPVGEKASDLEEIKKSIAELSKALAPLGEVLKSLSESTQANTEAIAKVSGELTKSVEGINKEFGERMTAVEGSTAIRKSAGLGEVVQQEPVKQTGIWGGLVLDTAYNN